jgi:GNAT superfamily N-acetyltransferase
MQIIFQGNTLELGDIEIFERYPLYRNSGIGTQMFRLLVAYAKEHNISRINGFMKPETKEMWPKLFGFYRSLGCEIQGKQFFYSVSQDR